MSALSVDARNLSWLVESFTDKVPGVARALVVSADGLPLVMSRGLDRVSGDQLAAIASGLSSLTSGAARVLHAGEVRQTIVEMGAGFLFVAQISDGSILAVLTVPEADLGLVGYEMALLVARVGDALTPSLRAELQTALPGLTRTPAVSTDPGRMARPYTLTGGRTRPTRSDLAPETLLITTPIGAAAVSSLRFEARVITEHCTDARSVAEIASRLDVPLGVARVLISDLATEQYLTVHTATTVGDRPDQGDAGEVARWSPRTLR